MQETDLLSFQIAIKLAKPAGVMCSYNRVNGDYACENDYTLGVLKKDWGFQGWVLSDWEGDAQHGEGCAGGTRYGAAGGDVLWAGAEAGRAGRQSAGGAPGRHGCIGLCGACL